jgi:hypothetical protein
MLAPRQLCTWLIPNDNKGEKNIAENLLRYETRVVAKFESNFAPSWKSWESYAFILNRTLLF